MIAISVNRRSLESIERDFEGFDPSNVVAPRQKRLEPQLKVRNSEQRPVAMAGMAATAALVGLIVLASTAV